MGSSPTVVIFLPFAACEEPFLQDYDRPQAERPQIHDQPACFPRSAHRLVLLPSTYKGDGIPAELTVPPVTTDGVRIAIGELVPSSEDSTFEELFQTSAT